MNKILLLSICFLVCSFALLGQESKKVKLKIHYKNDAMCYWDITLKHGDVKIAEGKTDANGVVEFGYVRLASNVVDVYGVKKIPGGDKNFNVTGYVELDNNGYSDLDLVVIVEELGVPESTIIALWGLDLGCGGSSGSSSSSSENGYSSSSSSSSTNGNVTTTSSTKVTYKTSTGMEEEEPEKKEPTQLEKWNAESEAAAAKREAEKEAERKQRQEDWASGKTQAEGLENSKTMQSNKIARLQEKINDRTADRSKEKTGSKTHDELSYEIRDLELERDITKIKLERTEFQIAKSATIPLTKAEKIGFESRIGPLEEEQKVLKQQQKDGVPFGGVKAVEETKTATAKETAEAETEEKAAKTYTTEELAAMSAFNLKKLKLDLNSTITKRKLTLKTKAAFLTPTEKTTIEQEIVSLEQQVQLVEAEIAKRDTEE